MEAMIFTDGSSLGNPGPGGFCALIRAGKSEHIVKGGAADTTNNRMEMSAIIAGLYTLHKKYPKQKSCAVYSDSNLIISTLRLKWKRKKNLDLWEKLNAAREPFEKIEWNWVRGHAGHPENTRVDAIAFGEAKKYQRAQKANARHEA